MDEVLYSLAVNGPIEPHELMHLRSTVGWKPDVAETWAECLRSSLCVVSVRERVSNELVGVGWLVGNNRHAQLVDMTVHPAHQRRGIGRRLQEVRLNYASSVGVRHITLTLDTSKPWLGEFYRSMGFVSSDDAMYWAGRSS